MIFITSYGFNRCKTYNFFGYWAMFYPAVAKLAYVISSPGINISLFVLGQTVILSLGYGNDSTKLLNFSWFESSFFLRHLFVHTYYLPMYKQNRPKVNLRSTKWYRKQLLIYQLNCYLHHSFLNITSSY